MVQRAHEAEQPLPPEALRAFAQSATDALGGRLDLLVHNAAVCPAVDTPGLTDDDLEVALAVNVREDRAP